MWNCIEAEAFSPIKNVENFASQLQNFKEYFILRRRKTFHLLQSVSIYRYYWDLLQFSRGVILRPEDVVLSVFYISHRIP